MMGDFFIMAKDNDSKNIFRVQKDKSNPYVMLNKGFLNNPKLSWKAKGLLAYLLSKPDDWKVILEHLYTQSPDGEKSVRSGINELKEYNHVMKYPVYRGNRISHWETTIFETPFTEEQRIKSMKIMEDGTETVVLAQIGKVLHDEQPVLSCFVQVQDVEVQKVNVQNEVLLSNDSIVINNPITNQSINPQKEDKRLMERLNGIMDNIDFEYLKVQGVDHEFISAATKVIMDMLFTETELKICGSLIPASIIQKQLDQIDAYKLEYVYDKFKDESRLRPITNENGYLRSMIYNSLSGEYLSLTAKVNYSALGIGRTENL